MPNSDSPWRLGLLGKHFDLPIQRHQACLDAEVRMSALYILSKGSQHSFVCGFHSMNWRRSLHRMQFVQRHSRGGR